MDNPNNNFISDLQFAEALLVFLIQGRKWPHSKLQSESFPLLYSILVYIVSYWFCWAFANTSWSLNETQTWKEEEEWWRGGHLTSYSILPKQKCMLHCYILQSKAGLKGRMNWGKMHVFCELLLFFFGYFAFVWKLKI